MREIKGELYCLDHQGSHYHSEPKNCTVCQLRQQGSPSVVATPMRGWKVL